MEPRPSAVLAWLLCGIIILASLWGLVQDAARATAVGDTGAVLYAILWRLIPIVFVVVGALIVSRQPRNMIGWLVMTPPISLILSDLALAYVTSFAEPPIEPGFLFFFTIWFASVSWVFFIFPLFLIALLFPTGRPPSPRWRWVVALALGMMAFFLGVTALIQPFTLDAEIFGKDWAFANPIGLVSPEQLEAILFPWWSAALGVLAVLSLASLGVRYWRAGVVEREQLKWLLYSSGLFAVVYVIVPELNKFAGEPVAGVLNALFLAAVYGFPISIGIAILRYRLFDIDIIIRRTVTYALVTAMLVFVFFSSVIVLQRLFAGLTGAGPNEIVTVLSTLAIAALFVPLRNWVQNAIDRRFNRKKYDAQQVLNDFAMTVRDETDLERLTARLMQVVDETMQPKSVSVWLKSDRRPQTADSER